MQTGRHSHCSVCTIRIAREFVWDVYGTGQWSATLPILTTPLIVWFILHRKAVLIYRFYFVFVFLVKVTLNVNLTLKTLMMDLQNKTKSKRTDLAVTVKNCKLQWTKIWHLNGETWKKQQHDFIRFSNMTKDNEQFMYDFKHLSSHIFIHLIDVVLQPCKIK